MPERFEFDDYLLDLRDARLSRGGVPVKLTSKSLSVLTLLVERAPNVVSRAEFEAVVWPEGFIDPGNLTQTIYMVRKALGERKAPIETVNGRGYRLTTDVRAIETAQSPTTIVPNAYELIDADRIDRAESVDARTKPSTNHASPDEPNLMRRALASFQQALGRSRRTTVALFAIASAAGTIYAVTLVGH